MMKRFSYIFTLLLMGVLLVSCSNDKVEEIQTKNKNISLRLMVQNYKGVDLRSGFFADDALEKNIDNLYIIIFTTDEVYKYDVTSSGVSGENGGSWNKEDGEILLGLTQDKVGANCDVYVFANVNAVKSQLAAATTASALQGIAVESTAPWSNNFSSPLLMSGYKTGHNFIAEPVLNKINMERAVAKLQIDIELTQQYQSTVVAEYQYRLRNFDKNTYVIKPEEKTNSLAYQADFAAISGIIEFVKSGTTVTGLKLTTYLNERDVAAKDNIALDLILPFWDDGAPPPQFQDDIYSVVIDKEIKRNHFYTYKVKM